MSFTSVLDLIVGEKSTSVNTKMAKRQPVVKDSSSGEERGTRKAYDCKVFCIQVILHAF